MCRMVGVVFRERFPLDTLRDLQHVAETGAVPDQGDEPPGHRDGWGIASFMGRSPRYVGRSERPMHLDPSYDAALDTIPSLERPNILIAHARRGSEGSRSLVNTHPFIGDGIVFAHNGTVKRFHPQTRHAAKGQTDSERLFMALLDRMEEKGRLGDALSSVIREDVAGHEYSAVMLLVSDGSSLYAYRDYHDEKDSWYYDMRVSRCPDVVTVFQESFSGYSGDVTRLDRGELVTVDLDLNISRERLA